MKKTRLYICVGIFIILTAVRIFYPALNEKIADEMAQVFSMELYP